MLLPVSVPSHSSLMRGAGAELVDALANANFTTPEVTVINATEATPYIDADDIRTRLARQVYSPVQWVNTINAMLASGATRIIECGPGKVLAGLVRRIDKSTPVAVIDSPAGLLKSLQS